MSVIASRVFLAQLAKEARRCLVVDCCARGVELQADRRQRGADTVVQVAAQPATLLLARADQPLARAL